MSDCFRPGCNPADGFERTIITVNRELPGEGIEVCRGDIVVVDVVNKLLAATTSVHWHGLYMRGSNDDQPQATAWSDGVPGVTQCLILPGESFRYQFVANPAGTH